MAQPATPTGTGATTFVTNVLWSWLAVGVTIAAGLIVSPLMIRKLGDESFGIWVLVFSLVEYCWVLDLGLVSATIKFSAHYRALNQPDKINGIVNTGAAYYSVVALALIGLSLAIAPVASRWFRVSAERQYDFSVLIAIAGISWGLGAVFNVFNAFLNGFQRFDITSKVRLLVTTTRTAAILTLLITGHGLPAIGLAILVCQAAGYVYSYVSLRRVFPELKLTRRFVRLETFREMAGYGVHSFQATVATQVVDQGPAVIIGHYVAAAAVGYYALPQRLMYHALEAITRVSVVSWSKAAEWSAHKRTDAITTLGAYANRYCLALIMPLSITLLVYGFQILRVWVGPDFASRSAPVIPAFVCSITLALAAQSSSGSILYGMGRHGTYSRFLLAEAILLVCGVIAVTPRYGYFAAAWVTSGLMIANRALLTPWLLTRVLGVSWTRYMLSVYGLPFAIAAPVFAGALALRATVLPGNTLIELAAAIMIVGAAYYGLTLRFCIEPEHRAAIFAAIRRWRVW